MAHCSHKEDIQIRINSNKMEAEKAELTALLPDTLKVSHSDHEKDYCCKGHPDR